MRHATGRVDRNVDGFDETGTENFGMQQRAVRRRNRTILGRRDARKR
jgi:hypothetical protein